jgi:riboflavin kinase/FMN adenylyltransferase
VKIIGRVLKGKGEAGPVYGLPTANVAIRVSLKPGAYVGEAKVRGKTFPALLYSGVDPKKLEVHLFGFSGDILGEELTVELGEMISKHVTFESEEQMMKKIKGDIALAKAKLCLLE